MAARYARIILADHQVLFRQNLAYHLANAGHEVVCEVGEGSSLDQCMIDAEPQLVILDYYLPGLDTMAYIRMMNALQPQTHLLILVAYEHEAHQLQTAAFLAGAAGCLSKELAPAAYLAAIRRVLEGQVLFLADVMRRAARPTSISGPAARLSELTQREAEILTLVAEGISNREIADRFGISYHTVMKHVSNIINKLKVHNRMEAGLLFLRYGSNAILSEHGSE